MTGHRSSDDDAESDDAAPDHGDGDDPVTCAECGAVVDTSSWYPVVGCGDSSYEIYHFCDRACRDAWTDRHC
jgi:hypothetical protein